MHFSTFTWFQFGGLSFFFALVRLAILYAFIHPGCTSHVLGTFSARDEQTSSMSTSVLQPSATSLGLKRMVDSTKNYIDVAAGFLVLMNLGSVKKEKDEDISASRINGFHRSHQEKWRMLFHDLGACIDCWASGIKKNQLVFVQRSWILMLQVPHCLSWLFFSAHLLTDNWPMSLDSESRLPLAKSWPPINTTTTNQLSNWTSEHFRQNLSFDHPSTIWVSKNSGIPKWMVYNGKP